MIHSYLSLPSGARVSLIIGLVLGWLLVFAGASYADYRPQGGSPPNGGTTTSGMGLY